MHKQALAINTQSGATMSSVEIAKLTGKRHDNVVRDIRNMLEQLDGDCAALALESVYTDIYNRDQTEFVLGLRGVLTLLSGYTVRARNAAIAVVARQVTEHQEVMDALRAFDLGELPVEMFLYVARNKDTGNLKIGISRDPRQRIKSLQVGCDGLLQLVATVSAKNGYQSEMQAHARLSSSLIHGEWFSASQEQAMEALQ